MERFAEQLSAARKASGMTQDALAKAADVTRQTISSWERGRTVPDIDKIRLLSDIVGVDLTAPSETEAEDPAQTPDVPAPDPAAPAEAESPAPTPDVPAPETPRKTELRRALPWLIAGAVLLCAALLILPRLSRGSAPGGGADVFDAEIYLNETANEAGKAYLAFNNTQWEERGDSQTFTRYAFKMYEKNGIGYEIASIEFKAEGKQGNVRTTTLSAADLTASGLNPSIAPYGEFVLDGGFPKGEYVLGGVTVYGSDANGAPITFHSLIRF